MKYEHIPRPDIEHHHHIRNLIERQEVRSKDKIIHQNRVKEQAERDKDIQMAKRLEVTEFWCDVCSEDFAELAWKQVETDWSNTAQRIAFYKSKHECGNWCIKHITDKFNDPYWSESLQVANDRGKHHNDLIQPFESGYQLLYGRKNT